MAIAQERCAHLDALAARLAAAWLAHGEIDGVRPEERPRTREQAYRVQDRMAAVIAAPIRGWKVGATSPKMRELDGHDDVIPGRILAPTTFVGARQSLAISQFPHARVETEFAFRLHGDVAVRDSPWTATELAPRATLHPALEIIGDRYPKGDGAPKADTLLTIADNGGGIGFVFGEPVADWRGTDLRNHRISLKVDDGLEAENFLGEWRCVPIEALADLVNHLAGRGIGLAAGDFVSTGAATVPQPVGAGSRVVADFGTLGSIEVRFE